MIRPLMSCLLVSLCAFAQASSLTIVTMTGSGSFADTVLRRAAPSIERHLGRPVVVQNMPGADGQIALNAFNKLPKDGSAVLSGNSSLAYLAVKHDTSHELKPIVAVAQSPLAVYVQSASVARGINDLAGRPLLAASTSPMVDMAVALLDESHGLRSERVGYKQLSQAILDLAAGRIDYLIAPTAASAVQAQVDAGRLRVLHTLGPRFGWSAFFVPKSLPESETTALQRSLQTAVDEAVAPEHAWQINGRTLQSFIDSETAVIRRVVDAGRVKLQQ